MSPVNGSSLGTHREQLVPIEFERARPPEDIPDHITLPPLLKPAPPGGSSTSRVALGTDFGVTFRMASPRPHPAPASCPKAKEQELSAGGGEDKKKVRPESVPGATRDVELPEPFKITHLPYPVGKVCVRSTQHTLKKGHNFSHRAVKIWGHVPSQWQQLGDSS